MNTSEKTVIRWGVLGAGSVAQRRVMPAMNADPSCLLRSLMVRDRTRAEQLSARFGAERACTSVEELLDDPSLDAVYISSPVHLHAEHAEAAASAGKHVLCEKPMGRTADDCRRILRACTDAGVHLEVCFVLRGWPIYQQVRRQIADGGLGRLVEIRAHLAKWTTRAPDEWRLDPRRAGGGALTFAGQHPSLSPDGVRIHRT